MVLPVSIYSSAYVTLNARRLMNFLSLRARPRARTSRRTRSARSRWWPSATRRSSPGSCPSPTPPSWPTAASRPSNTACPVDTEVTLPEDSEPEAEVVGSATDAPRVGERVGTAFRRAGVGNRVRRHRSLVAVGAAALVVLVAGGVYLVRRPPPVDPVVHVAFDGFASGASVEVDDQGGWAVTAEYQVTPLDAGAVTHAHRHRGPRARRTYEQRHGGCDRVSRRRKARGIGGLLGRRLVDRDRGRLPRPCGPDGPLRPGHDVRRALGSLGRRPGRRRVAGRGPPALPVRRGPEAASVRRGRVDLPGGGPRRARGDGDQPHQPRPAAGGGGVRRRTGAYPFRTACVRARRRVGPR